MDATRSRSKSDERPLSRFALGLAAALTAFVVWLAFNNPSELNAVAQTPASVSLDPACLHWDKEAAEVVAHLSRDINDVSLRQASDAVFRLRRARGNCRGGWINFACLDYRAIVRMQDDGFSSRPPQIVCEG